MEKPVAVIEITDSTIRLVVGNVLDKKVFIIYTTEKPNHGLVSRTDIVDKTRLTQLLSSLAHIKSDEARLVLTIPEATMILPSSGFQIFDCDKTTTVVSQTGIIDNVDIRNVTSLVQKEIPPQGSEIVDIIPESFSLDNGMSYSYPPVGEKTNYLGVHAIVHTLPKNTIASYSNCLISAHIRPQRSLIAPYCASEYIKSLKDAPASYLLVDMNDGYSSITLVNNHMPFYSGHFLYGLNDLILNVAQEFNIDESEAKSVLFDYGLDERELGFDCPLINSSDELGNELSYSQKDLNEVIKKYMSNYCSQFEATYSNLLEGHSSELKKLPILLIGDLLRVRGIDTLFEEKFNDSEYVKVISSSVVGARGPEYVSLIGALLVCSKYKGSLSEEKSSISELKRDE